MQANPRIQSLLSKIADRGITYRLLWTAARFGKKHDIYMLSFHGEQRPAIGTAIILDYGQDGFGFFPESGNVSINDDAELVHEGQNGMVHLMRDLEAFNKACDVRESKTPRILAKDVDLVKKLITEEQRETFEGLDSNDIVEVADGLADLIYVCVQAARKFGIPLASVWRAVQRSNMAKVDPATGKVSRRQDGKILKPEGWRPPDVAGILAEATNGR